MSDSIEKDKARLLRMGENIKRLQNEIDQLPIKPSKLDPMKKVRLIAEVSAKNKEFDKQYKEWEHKKILEDLSARLKKLGGSKSRRKARKQGSSKKTRSKRVRKQTRRL
jgi:hypothetical protein